MDIRFNRYLFLAAFLLPQLKAITADARAPKHFAPPSQKMVALAEALHQIQGTFHVNFNYSSATIANKFVPAEKIPVKGGFTEDKLSALLQPLGLVAEKLDATDYAIKPAVTTQKQSYTFNVAASRASHVVKGVVTNDKEELLAGVAVTARPGGKTVLTNATGAFSIEVEGDDVVLVFSSAGYLTQELKAGNNATLNVQLQADIKNLDNVVVTALGIKRQEKALGYSIATIDGSKVNTVKEVNVVNALSGKVAGVDIRAVSSDPGSSVLITIRGSSSISSGSQPLFVVDGVPISSGNRTPATPVGQVTVDYGSPISDINPDDIASISVLKGASAAALYGSRAGNGVVLITTKSGSGKSKKGLNVQANFNAMYDKAWQFPEFQNEFGAGDVTSSTDPTNTLSTASWGPRLDQGTKYVQWNSPTDVNGNLVPTDWVSYPNRVKDFFETGSTYTTNVAVSGNNFRLSYTNLQNKGISPNTDLQRNTVNLAAGYELSPKIKVTTNVAYANNHSKNRPTFNRGSASYIIYTMPGNINPALLKNYWQKDKEGLAQFSQDQGSTDNPYFVAYELTNGYNRNRLTGNIQLNIDLLKNLSLMVRSGVDFYSETDESKRAFSAVQNPNGGYSIGSLFQMERNTDFLLTYKKNLKKDWSFFVSAGGNRMDANNNSQSQAAGTLVMPGVYNIANAAAGVVTNNSSRSTRRINSIYGMGELSYSNYAFLNLTARNDWSSTLPSNHNSYFYPSASLSFIVSDMLHLNSKTVSFAKVRMNWSKVGKDTDPYNLYNNFTFASPDWGSVKMATFSATLKNNNLKPEIATSYEAGTDLKFFNNRLGIEATYYSTSSRNQIVPIPTSMSSGYSTKIINTGEIRNSGWEIGVNGTPVTGAFTWNISANFTRNRNKVVSLSKDLSSYSMGSAEGVQYQIMEGTQMGDMYGNTWKTVPDGPHKGEELLDNTGHSQAATGLVKIGNYNPDFMAGFTNAFTYKQFSLNTLLDWRQGGQFFSYVFMNLLSDGRTVNTLYGRDAAHGGVSWNDNGVERNDGMIENGYISDGNGGYVKNTNVTDPESYYGDYYWKMHQRNTFSATYVKLREASLTYTFTKKQLSRLPFTNLSVALIGRNLFSYTAAGKGYDPETAMTIKSGSIVPGTASWSLPYTRSYGVKLSVNF
ncbi:TonB-linked outer membrane protein, SusC/RagA family [Filimonas lacunae]|uniref:TonB-linked outer membrane protein, SusC/RagA family n=1 Tax=Filimonas lacunae TaxID=477680 RepID=A0A173MJP5_9BACT|nr:SusC/RagA family TonB-linked outer membrane protein [Filimonas lacunae]BAV07862.1 TonB-dependent receptor plug [Filimonas lacunae]SIT05761.1 TonB-linked outer membrane protein, SusC/RagA family [Filimonas lacunae]